MIPSIPRRRGASTPLLLAASLLLVTAGCKGRHSLNPISDPVADRLGDLSQQTTLSGLHWPNFPDYHGAVQTFYSNRDNEPAWIQDGKPTPAAQAFIRAFQAADTKGLIPEDYDASLWQSRVAQLSRKNDDDAATFDLAMTVAVMRYLSNVHAGRINPTHLNFEIDTASKQLDLPQVLADKAVGSGDVPALVSSLEPDSEEYRKTEQALGTYLQLARQQAASPQLQQPLPDVASAIAPGGQYPALPALVARLQFETNGTAESGSDAPQGTTYTPAIAAAVKAFQQTHSLPPDGRLSSSTIAALNVPMSQRVLQLDDSLERWRWLPDTYLHPAILVNLPEFLLRAYSNDSGSYHLDFTMKVIDGKAEGGHATPVFTHMMRYLIFRPFWNLPMSIIKKELMAHIGKSGIGYLAAKGYQTVNAHGDPVDATPEQIERGGVVVRQKPGADNALGLVKFMFPNQYDIYIHSTNEKPLFARTRRDLSHGCVRVQDPTALAVWVLHNQAGDWDEEKVTDAMQTGPDNHQVSLKTPLPVTIGYFTAFVNEDGQVEFFNDLYGYDAQMNAVLQHGMPYPDDVVKINPNTTPGDTT